MMKKWVKILPYWLVVRLCRSFTTNTGKLKVGSKDYDVAYFQIDEGEFVLFCKDVQDIFDKRRTEKKKEKTDRRLEKLNKQLSKDYSLREKLEEQFKNEREEIEE